MRTTEAGPATADAYDKGVQNEGCMQKAIAMSSEHAHAMIIARVERVPEIGLGIAPWAAAINLRSTRWLAPQTGCRPSPCCMRCTGKASNANRCFSPCVYIHLQLRRRLSRDGTPG